MKTYNLYRLSKKYNFIKLFENTDLEIVHTHMQLSNIEEVCHKITQNEDGIEKTLYITNNYYSLIPYYRLYNPIKFVNGISQYSSDTENNKVLELEQDLQNECISLISEYLNEWILNADWNKFEGTTKFSSNNEYGFISLLKKIKKIPKFKKMLSDTKTYKNLIAKAIKESSYPEIMMEVMRRNVKRDICKLKHNKTSNEIIYLKIKTYYKEILNSEIKHEMVKDSENFINFINSIFTEMKIPHMLHYYLAA